MFRFFRSKKQRSTASPASIAQHRADPHFPFLISFPRTGSHWLRMLLERYTDQPLLVRSFYPHRRQDYLLLHTHDKQLTEQRQNVLYLYRHPLNVIYSQLKFYNQPVHDENLIVFWAQQYSAHLIHWCFREKITTHKTLITYEGLQRNMEMEFRKVTTHLNLSFDAERLAQVQAEISKAQVAQQTKHDQRVMNLTDTYEAQRRAFHARHQALIVEVFEQTAQWSLGTTDSLWALFDENLP
ncbi:MAG: hypothetical protein AAGD05_07980 [Bacteroidota bacterium]